MKIGIITFWNSNDNYGQILQSYALQRFLRDNGFQAYVIRYQYTSKEPKAKKRLLKIIRVYPAIISLINRKRNKALAHQKAIANEMNKLRDFDNFRNNNISYSKKIYHNLDELRISPPVADCYITGSDQVWHYHFLSYEGAPYFLDFGNDDAKRISYAPSFRFTKLPKDKIEIMRKQLSHFDHISVREESGIEICKSLGYEAIQVVDPTLLVSPKDYSPYISKVEYKRYAFFYILNINSKDDIHWDIINEYTKSKRLESIVTVSSGYNLMHEWFPKVKYEYCGIPKWLSLIKYSDIFFTTSFHGVVFSLILHTNFVFLPIGTNEGSNSRIESLLSPLGLKYRIWDYSTPLEQILQREIDWNKVDADINIKRSNSGKWLINSLQEK